MATVPDAPLILISSPYARRGVLWDEYRAGWGKENASALVWVSPTSQMNPTVPSEVIEQALAEDEAAARSEYFAEFRRDLEAFVSREVLDACTVPDRHEVPPMSGTKYVAFTDPSGGSADSWTLAIAHGEKRGTQWVAVLDAIREIRPPFIPSGVVEGFSQLLKAYGIKTVVGDRYGGQFPVDLFAKHGVTYRPSERVKSEIYLETLPRLNGRCVELLDHRRLATQLAGLERRTARGGKDSVDHAPRSHDDIANAVCGALILAGDGPSDAIPQAANLMARPYQPTNWAARELGGSGNLWVGTGVDP